MTPWCIESVGLSCEPNLARQCALYPTPRSWCLCALDGDRLAANEHAWGLDDRSLFADYGDLFGLDSAR